MNGRARTSGHRGLVDGVPAGHGAVPRLFRGLR